MLNLPCKKKPPSSNSAKRGASVRDISRGGRSVVSEKQREEETFKVHQIQQDREIPAMEAETAQEVSEMAVPNEEGTDVFDEDSQILSSGNQREEYQRRQEPREFVKVKFSKFVQLVTARDCADIVANNDNEDVVMNSNLLTELASAHDEREEKKIPLVFLVGLAIGVIITYILITK